MKFLSVENVSRHFGSLIAVDSVSMNVEAGELRAIIGPNGAGKTTFFNLISGMLPSTAGRILFDGNDITNLSARQRVALGMARTFQITEIFPELTVRENVRTPVEIAAGLRLFPFMPTGVEAKIRGRLDELLTMGGLTKIADRLAGELSHGDQRSTEIMMALALKPRLLLLDEPTAGMGEEETYAVTQLIRRLHKETHITVVLIEHDMRVVFRLADRITVLDQGKSLAEGTPSEISANAAVQAAYLGKAA
jgi:branched-chain amino acid transport system ATP-binding protein